MSARVVALLALCLAPVLGSEAQATGQAVLPAASVPAAPAVGSSFAADHPSEGEAQVVEVSGMGNIDWKPYKTMVMGIDAYHANWRLAPHASLRFLMRPQSERSELQGLTMSLVGKTTSIEIPVSSDGAFSLPRDERALAEQAELVLNRKKGLFKWVPDIRSPSVPANARRLGDMRLECEVQWAVEKPDVSLLLRGALGLAGGPCKSSRLRPMRPVYGKLRHLTLVHGERREAVPFRINGLVSTYLPPFADKNWPDDSLLEFEFEN